LARDSYLGMAFGRSHNANVSVYR